MRAFVIVALIILASGLLIFHFQEVSQAELAKKQISDLTQRISVLEKQAENVKVLKSDMRTLDVKIDTLREALKGAANAQATSLSTDPGNVTGQSLPSGASEPQ